MKEVIVPIEKPSMLVKKHIFRDSEAYAKKDRVIECYSDGTQSKPKFKQTDRTDKIAIWKIHFKAYKRPTKQIEN